MSSTARSLKVGIFVTVGLGALFVLVFLLGQKQGMFQRKLHLRASFDNVAGLMVGTPVRLAGMNVGVVDGIELSGDARDARVHVDLSIAKEYAARIRDDSIARLGSKGVLGDTIVDLTVGGADAAKVKNGDELRSKEAMSMSAVVEDVGGAIGEVRSLAMLARNRVEAVLTDKVAADVGATVHSLASITREAQAGNGPVHQLIYDKKLAARIDEVSANAAQATSDISLAAHGIKDDLDHGRGTIGALLKDPTVYEDVKLLLGNARRSRVLRTVIRYAVNHGAVKADEAAASSQPVATPNDVATLK
jgi:phospholipid/cholesterol/gamma-HCH transport system substrate-binding protein